MRALMLTVLTLCAVALTACVVAVTWTGVIKGDGIPLDHWVAGNVTVEPPACKGFQDENKSWCKPTTKW